MALGKVNSNVVDVLVIGAGILGASTASYLSRMNKKVAIVDAQLPMRGTTAQAASVLIRHRADSTRQSMMDETYHKILSFEQDKPDSTGFMQTGCVHVGGTPAADASAMRAHDSAHDAGRESAFLRPQQLKKICPWLNVSKEAAVCLDEQDGYVDAYSLGNAYLTDAVSHGARLVVERFAHSLMIDGQGCLTGVKFSDGGCIYADSVVLCAGSWSTKFLSHVDVMLPMAPVRSQYWMVDGISSLDRYSPITVIPDASCYTRPDGNDLLFGYRDSSMIYGSPEELPIDLFGYQFDKSEGERDLEEAFLALEPFVPSLLNAGIKHYTAGVSSYTLDGQFVLGSVESIPNLYVGTGCCGSGIAMSAGFGRVLSELACGLTPYLDISAYAPDRMPDAMPFDPTFQYQCAAARSRKA